MTTWPEDPDGSLVPILEASVEEAKQRHPSSLPGLPGVVLTAADRCDHCGGPAVFRAALRRASTVLDAPPTSTVLDFCGHSYKKNSIMLAAEGWTMIGANPDLMGDFHGGTA